MIVTEVAPVEVQVNVELPPGEIEVGDAVSVTASVPETVTVAVAVTEPPVPVAVAVYVVVWVGETDTVPLVARLLPTLLSMLTAVAFVVLHVKVEEPPELIEVGEAENVIVGEADVAVTVTVAFAVPPAPVAVPVNVVVALTATVADPDSANAVWSSPPMPGFMANDVAFVVLHVSVTRPPAGTELALAVSVTVGGVPPLATVMLTVFFADPPGPSASAVNVVFADIVTDCEPASGNAFELIEGEIVTDVALLDAQVRVTVPPEVTLVASVLNVRLGAGVDCFGDELPPHERKSNERVNTLTTKKACVGRRRDTEFLQEPGRDF